MLKENSKIKVHLFGTSNKEIKTRNFDKVFTVYKKGGKLGIDWNTEHSQYLCKGDIFTPFNTFASSVIFEDIENGKQYYFDNITNNLKSQKILKTKD